MFVSLKAYAELYDRSGDTVRRLAEQGRLTTAKKVGRNWVVDSNEPYPTRQHKFTVASLFSGCGGMDLGFLGGFDFLGRKYSENPFEIVWANEINKKACETYARNISPDIVCGDIANEIDTLPEHVDVVIGGFPCQDISVNGKMLGIEGERSSLYTWIVEAVRRTEPLAFVAENVGGLMLKKHDKSRQKILSDFDSLGYSINFHLYNASDYGVPQTRERVFIVGTRRGCDFHVPEKITEGNPVTAFEAIGDLETMEENREFSHIWSRAKASGEQGNRHLEANRPGYTIRAECHGNTQFHYCLPRRISMREEARIQSFPDSFLFSCGIRETERQLGNAVPPVLAWHVARALAAALYGGTNEKRDVRGAFKGRLCPFNSGNAPEEFGDTQVECV